MALISLLPLFLLLISASTAVAQGNFASAPQDSGNSASPPSLRSPNDSPGSDVYFSTGSDGNENSGSGEYEDSTTKDSKRDVLISVFTCLFFLCILVFAVVRWNRRRRKSSAEAREESGRETREDSDVELDECFSRRPRKFSYDELCAATRNFCDAEKLGQGGFGGVYKGILPGTAEAVAVKRISEGSKQGRKEYISEVTTISKLRHRNLVQLLGWCHQKGELLLVYEYLPKGSLDKYLFGNQNAILNWDRKYSIACDIAAALVYLHEDCEQRVVHRDVKASNVMLDSDFNAKLGDFGLARLLERDQATSQTTALAGTFGYLAPEYVYTGKASTESDVFSFGAVTLEIACGRQPLDPNLNKRLVEWVWDSYGQGRLFESADHRLHGNFKDDEMERLLLLGLLCSHPDPKARPKMRDALKILKCEAQLPNVPLKLPVVVVVNADRVWIFADVDVVEYYRYICIIQLGYACTIFFYFYWFAQPSFTQLRISRRG